ncbi:hypothetical protein ACFFGT_30495 [Mucilaginibacter angelicae]|uniref:Uncharacterized protein n=1 Tax=Mucilaginibacter angelicae TaxID=869718 RepID=A0ABV6LGL9_9SPHI
MNWFCLAKKKKWRIIKKRLRDKECPDKGFGILPGAVFNVCYYHLLMTKDMKKFFFNQRIALLDTFYLASCRCYHHWCWEDERCLENKQKHVIASDSVATARKHIRPV